MTQRHGLASEDERARWIAPAAAFAIIAIGRALQIRDGFLHPDAIVWITAALAVTFLGAALPRSVAFARLDARLVVLLAVVGVAANVVQLYSKPPILVASLAPNVLVAFNRRLAALTATAVLTVWSASRRSKPVHVAALVAAHFVLGVWTIHQSPAPGIDVHIFQHDAIAALHLGRNPYAMTYPNIYPNAQFYGSDLSVNGRLQFGFPYFPLSLLLAMPGQLLAGDHRYAQLVALELAAVLMAFARSKGFGPMAAAMFLTTPRIFFVLEQAWTEPFVVFGLAVVVFGACRYSAAVPWLFGAFAALKQYLILAIPAALLLARPPREAFRFLTKASIVGMVVTLPFVLWSPRAFWTSVIVLQFHQPFRVDSLSYLAWWMARGHTQPPEAIAFIAAGVAAGIALWRLPRTPAGFAAAVALTFFAFFAFNKQAFCNYYFLVVGAFAVALAACAGPEAA